MPAEARCPCVWCWSLDDPGAQPPTVPRLLLRPQVLGYGTEGQEMGVWFTETLGGHLKVRCLEGPDSLSAPILAQLPLRGFAGRWISRLSACGWRSPRQSASCKTGPSIPRAPRVWEQVTAQNGPRFCRNPAPLSGGSQRQGVACRFLLFRAGRGGVVTLRLITQSCPARPPDGE